MEELKIGVVTMTPFINECWRTCKEAGFIMETVKLLCKSYSFSCIYIDSEFNGTYNSSWNSIVERVRDGEFDTSVPVFSATPERYAMVDFSPTVFYMELFFILRTPQQLEMSFSKLMALRWNVWLCLIFCMLIIGVILTLATVRKIGKECLSRTVGNCLDMFALFTSQYPEMNLPRASSQILIGFWAVSALIVSGIYSGNLLRFLLRNELDYPFKDFSTFIDCLDRKECQLVLTSNSSSYYNILNNTEVEQFARIVEALARNNPIVNPSPHIIIEDILNIKDRYLVWFTTEAAFINTTNNNAGCHYTAVPSGYYDMFHFPLKKHSKFKKTINEFSLQFRAAGWHNKLFQRYIKKASICESEKINDGKPMPVSSMFSLLFVLSIGCVLGSFSFMLEKLSNLTCINVNKKMT